MTSPPNRFASLRRDDDRFSSSGRSVGMQASHPVQSSKCITITLHEYRGLQATSQKYANLRQNLLRSGKVDEQAIDLLSQDDEAIQKAPDPSPVARGHGGYNDDGGAALYDDDEHSTRRNHWGRFPTNSRLHNYARDRSPDDDAWSETDSTAGDDLSLREQAQNGKADFASPFERQCLRTLYLMNIAEGTTHGDITAAIRGGILLDIYIRSQERTATVSFLRAEDARYFFDHVKKHDLYIKNKRVDIKWQDRQFVLAGHMANKIASGATRNLVIRRCDPRIKEQTVREDLDHIHNLVVIKVGFVGGSCYIRTNSVNNAMFARTCMMSRALYKGSKIEWDVDECAQPYDPEPVLKPRRNSQPRKAAANPMLNRFQLLNLDDGDEEDDIAASLQQSKKVVDITA
ncbi:uncharacterized protein E0L32_009545 [Thyridium curvatum]|uniref:Uncharacterized protein n=1 Tax=Thyridium curvatum TaxID=1093900 RepID=A0A507AQK3_9PEZI|nr:uncharacterized protein E0L32_009545 [Thyridium curvatum]TPX08966.1 hypothetical protein E0L32_009545 [Thyridium curvatum]